MNNKFINQVLYGMVQFFCMIPVLIKIGQNIGATNNYFFQLWIPYLIDIVICFIGYCIDELHLKNTYEITQLLVLSILGSTVFFSFVNLFNIFYHPVFIDGDGYAKWKHVYQLVDGNAPNGNIFSSSVLSFYCMKEDINGYDYGSNEYCNEGITSKISGGYKDIIFPHALELNKKVIDIRNDAYNKISNGQYEMVVLTDGLAYYSGLEDILEQGGYHELECVNLQISSSIWNTHFYIK